MLLREYVPDLPLCVRISWVHEIGDCFGSRHQLVKQLQTFLLGRDHQLGDARDVATRTVEAGSKAQLDRIAADQGYDWDCAGSCLGRGPRIGSASGNDHVYSTPNQLSRQGRQSIILSLSPCVLDGNVLRFVVTVFSETVTKLIYEGQVQHVGQKANDRCRRLLRKSDERPASRCASQKRDELPPSHSTTSCDRSGLSWARHCSTFDNRRPLKVAGLQGWPSNSRLKSRPRRSIPST